MKAITQAEFETEVLRSAQPVLVDFYTSGCAPCRRLAPVLEEIEREQAGHWKIVKVDAEVEQGLAVRFRVNMVPTLLAFREGRCVAQRVGQASKPHLAAWLAEA